MSDTGPLTVSAAVEGGVGRVRLDGELDLDSAGAVAEEIARLASQGATEVEVDAGQLSFIDSSGLRALLSAREQLQAEGVTLRLTAVSPAVERVLEMTGTRALLTGD